MNYYKTHQKRFRITLEFFKNHVKPGATVLDLGVKNPLSEIIENEGYKVKNTKGEDLDIDYGEYLNPEVEVVTAFQIFEHMLAPYNILRNINASKLIASVPLRLWFADAFWIENDDLKKHYHEFEKKQFDFLLKKSGWKIKDHKMWADPPGNQIGIRPLLRNFYPRYYLVYCERY